MGCAAVVNVPVNELAPIVPLFAYTLPAVTFPVTAALVNVPTDVILGCAAVVNVPVNVAPVTAPLALTFPVLILPVTVNKLVESLNVKFALAPKSFALLY